ncbi:inositol monophosphatase family protein [Candidatus Binatia bacterium]|nr:inositol monophosphatase family protein [Candidatus Binatia bacterium]
MTGTNPGAAVDLAAAAAAIEPLLAEAGALTLRWFRTPVQIDDKGGAHGYDPVTEADRAVETLLRDGLTARFPEHAIVGEEHGKSGPPDARVRWIIDPIDGTRAFVSGIPEWGILVGLTVDGQPVAGWAHIPYLGETFAGVGGRGWFERTGQGQRQPLRTRPTTELAAATLFCTHPSTFAAAGRLAFERLAARVRLQRYGGDCYSYCLLALGHIDLVVESSLQPYDIVPLMPIIAAAGGVVTDPGGRPPLDGGTVIAAATPELHAQAMAVFGGLRS